MWKNPAFLLEKLLLSHHSPSCSPEKTPSLTHEAAMSSHQWNTSFFSLKTFFKAFTPKPMLCYSSQELPASTEGSYSPAQHILRCTWSLEAVGCHLWALLQTGLLGPFWQPAHLADFRQTPGIRFCHDNCFISTEPVPQVSTAVKLLHSKHRALKGASSALGPSAGFSCARYATAILQYSDPHSWNPLQTSAWAPY